MMESSQESRDPTAPAGQGASPAGQQVAPQGVESQEAVHEDQPAPAATGHAVPPGQERPGQDADREPAADQAPVATEAQKTITGDPGLRGEQVPQQVEGSPSAVDRPVGTSMPPPEAQSGMPLPEERAAAERDDEQVGAEQPEGTQVRPQATGQQGTS